MSCCIYPAELLLELDFLDKNKIDLLKNKAVLHSADLGAICML